MKMVKALSEASFALVMYTLAVVGLLLLTMPTIIILIASLTNSYSLKFPPPGYSFRWYEALLDAPQLHTAALNSLEVAAWTAVISVVFGTSAALGIARSRSAWSRLLDTLFMSPLIIPAVGFGLAFLMMMATLGIRLSMLTLIVAHVIVCVPFVLRTTIASLARLDVHLLESSASLGAGPLYTFWRVTLPSIRRGIGAGAFLAFMLSFDNVPVSLFVADARTMVLPIRMWQMIEGSLDVRTAAVSGVIVIATLIGMLAMEKLTGLSRQL